jgi:hypothetical protein
MRAVWRSLRAIWPTRVSRCGMRAGREASESTQSEALPCDTGCRRMPRYAALTSFAAGRGCAGGTRHATGTPGLRLSHRPLPLRPCPRQAHPLCRLPAFRLEHVLAEAFFLFLFWVMERMLYPAVWSGLHSSGWSQDQFGSSKGVKQGKPPRHGRRRVACSAAYLGVLRSFCIQGECFLTWEAPGGIELGIASHHWPNQGHFTKPFISGIYLLHLKIGGQAGGSATMDKADARS